MTPSAQIDEIFSSIQGEGPWVGERHIFVRFRGCDIQCRYCDTALAARRKDSEEGAGRCRVQRTSDSFDRELVPASIAASQLTAFCRRLSVPGASRPTISLTGGEPLLQCTFLRAWLPEMRNGYRIYLETNGLQYDAMADLQPLVDVVSMDLKLPSATGLRPFWDEHRKFLAASKGTSRYVKAVVTADTARDDVIAAAELVAEHDRSIPFVIQPAEGGLAPPAALLLAFQNAALGITGDVRVIPQVHKILCVP